MYIQPVPPGREVMNTIKNYTEGIEPLSYQQALWDKLNEGGFKQGELSVMSSGRQIGKSMWNNVWNNLCREILLEPMKEQKYKFSRKWHIGQFQWKDQQEVHEWCQENFGPMLRTPDAWSRWKTMPGNQIAFRDEGDLVLFILRWA